MNQWCYIPVMHVVNYIARITFWWICLRRKSSIYVFSCETTIFAERLYSRLCRPYIPKHIMKFAAVQESGRRKVGVRVGSWCWQSVNQATKQLVGANVSLRRPYIQRKQWIKVKNPKVPQVRSGWYRDDNPTFHKDCPKYSGIRFRRSTGNSSQETPIL